MSDEQVEEAKLRMEKEEEREEAQEMEKQQRKEEERRRKEQQNQLLHSGFVRLPVPSPNTSAMSNKLLQLIQAGLSDEAFLVKSRRKAARNMCAQANQSPACSNAMPVIGVRPSANTLAYDRYAGHSVIHYTSVI